MRLLLHLGRAAVIFWTAAILLPAAVAEATSPAHHRSAEAALHGVSATSGDLRERLGGLGTGVDGAEADLRRVAACVQLEVQRFIEQLP